MLGYVTWSISAYTQGLGLLPALEAQYFMAGVVPAFIVGTVWWVIHRRAAVNDLLRSLFSPETAILNGAFRKVFWVATALIFAMPVVPYVSEIQPDSLFIWTYLALGMFSVSAAPHVFHDPRRVFDPTDPVEVRQRGFGKIREAMRLHHHAIMLVYTVVVGAVGGLVLYGQYFRDLPPEFGGIGKRCAHLDLRADLVSRGTLEDLADPADLLPPIAMTAAPEAAAGPAAASPATPAAAGPGVPAGARVVRTAAIDVIFKSGAVLVVEHRGVRRELAPAVVQAIAWCGES